MHRKDMMHMIITIIVIVAAFYAVQAWILPTPQPPAPSPNEGERDPGKPEGTPPGDPDEATAVGPSAIAESRPTEALVAHGFDPIHREDARKWRVANSRLTAVISERGAVLETVEFVDHEGEVVYWHTPDDPRAEPFEPLELLKPLDIAPNLSPLALRIDENDNWRNTSRWELERAEVGRPNAPQSLTFRFPPSDAEVPRESDGTVIYKTITLLPGTYRMDVDIRIENHSDRALEKVVGIWGPVGITNDGSRSSAELTRIALYGSTESLRYSSLQGKPRMPNIGRDVNRVRADLGLERPWVTNTELDDITQPDRYLMAHGLRTQYFVAFLSHDPNVRSPRWSGAVLPLGDAGRAAALSMTGPPLSLPRAAGATPSEQSTRVIFYAGPRDKQILGEAWRAAPPEDQRLPAQWVDLGTSGFFDLIATPLVWFLRILTNWVGAGLAIILLTLIVRVALSPLSYRGQKAMGIYAQKMKVVKPKLDAIKEKYKDKKDRDSQMKMLTETRMAMREQNVGMLPLGGCLPMLLQLPIFIGLYHAFGTAFFLRQASFAWVDDLSLPDATIPGSWYMGEGLLSFLAYNGFLTINILPVLWIVLALVQFKIQPKPDDPQQAAIQKQMGCIFPIMGAIFYGFASGFALYFIISSIYSIGESKLVRHSLRKQGVLPPPKKKGEVNPDAKPDYHGA